MAKVLLVEDDNNLREIYEARLQAEGYDIVSARDGEEALVIAKQERPELVISDVMMPKISGFEMLDILRNTEGLKEVKVIMLTALGQAEDQTRADSLGADRYLVKSQVTLEDIVNAAQDLLTEAGALPAPEAAPAAPVAAPVVEAVAVAAQPLPTPIAPAPVEPVQTVQAAPVAAEPAVAAPIFTPAPQPVAADPVPEPTTQPTPVDTPVIPVAAAPPEVPEEAAMPSMPPTPMSTIPDEAPNEPAAEVVPSAETIPPTESFEPAPSEPVAMPEPAEPVTVPAAPIIPEFQTSEPQTEAQETATVEQQIQSFVDNQSGQPAKAAEPEATPADAPAEAVQPTATPEQEQALNDALTQLGGAPSPALELSAAPQSETPAAAAPASPAEAEAPSHQKKVIAPLSDNINGEPKKSINELLAAEEAKDTGNVVMPGAPQPPKNPNDFDPNSIAL